MKTERCLICGVFPREPKHLVCSVCQGNKPLGQTNWDGVAEATQEEARLMGQAFTVKGANKAGERIKFLPLLEANPEKREKLEEALEEMLALAKFAFKTGEKAKALRKAEEKEEVPS